MKASEVLKILAITRPTLTKYVKEGYIKVSKLPTGQYQYDEQSVWEFLGKKHKDRNNYIYARVSSPNQKKDLENQIQTLEDFSKKNNIIVKKIYKDIGSGVHFDRKEFLKLFYNVLDNKVNLIVISYKDRLSRLAFPLLKSTFLRFGTRIVVLDEIDNPKFYEKEIFEDLMAVIHSFSMKLYSSRRKKKLELVNKDLKLSQDLKED